MNASEGQRARQTHIFKPPAAHEAHSPWYTTIITLKLTYIVTGWHLLASGRRRGEVGGGALLPDDNPPPFHCYCTLKQGDEEKF